jgi:hypothetical protein
MAVRRLRKFGRNRHQPFHKKLVTVSGFFGLVSLSTSRQALTQKILCHYEKNSRHEMPIERQCNEIFFFFPELVKNVLHVAVLWTFPAFRLFWAFTSPKKLHNFL